MPDEEDFRRFREAAPGLRRDLRYGVLSAQSLTVRLARNTDAAILRNAVSVIRRRSARPKSFTVQVLVRALERLAGSLEQGE
jgi:hypothetical protein